MGRREYDCRRIGGPTDFAKTQSRECAGDCGVSPEQDRAVMRILKLTRAVEKELLEARERRDVQAEKVAGKIIADVRRRGDAALFSWTKKLDGINLPRQGVWVSQREIAEAQESVSASFLRAVKHA